MTLLELLVQELPKHGGWPTGASICERFLDESNIDFYDEQGNWPEDCGIKYGFSFAEKLVQPRLNGKGPRTEVVNKEEYESALAASKQPEHNVEPWIEWSGGTCPVERGTLIDVQYRDGKTLCRIPANKPHPGMRDAQASFWRNEARENDIVAYRLSESKKWNGEGLPPIGTGCEWQDKNTKAWMPVIVVYASEWVTVIREADKSYAVEIAIENFGDELRRQFRPIRTEAERKREDIIKQMSHSLRANGSITTEQLDRLYDDIANGNILGIKLDD